MAKVVVDQGLSETIKTIRIQNGVAAKDLAERLGKSRSYVSKLENGGIGTIDSDELVDALKFVSGNNKIDEVLENVFKTVSIRYTIDEINHMIWLYNFDTVYRRIPIPKDFTQSYSELLRQNDISYEELADEINKNLFIPREINTTDYTENVWFQFKNGTYIIMKTTGDKIKDILEGKKEKASYVILFAIALYFLRLTEYKHINTFTDDIIQEMNEKVRDILTYYKIYTLSGKQEMIDKATNAEEIMNSLSLHEKNNIEVMNRFNPLIQLYSYYDVVSANKLISEFTKNLEWEAPFVMEIAGLPFYKLGHCSFRLKKQILDDIRELLQKAMDLPENEKKREEY